MQDNQPTDSNQEVAPAPVSTVFSPEQIVSEFKAILLSPRQYFANMPVTGGFQQPVMFYGLVAAVISVGSILINITHPLAAIGGAIMSFILIMIFSFVGAAISMGLSRLVGGTGNYEATYRACSYSVAPHIVGWMPFINVFGAIYSAFLFKLALERAQNLPHNRALLVVAVQVGLGLIGFLIMAVGTLATLVSGNHP